MKMKPHFTEIVEYLHYHSLLIFLKCLIANEAINNSLPNISRRDYSILDVNNGIE
jgi:hypothetical protein